MQKKILYQNFNSNDSIILLYLQESQTGEEGGHSSEDSGHCSPEPQNEFLKVHAQLQARRTT